MQLRRFVTIQLNRLALVLLLGSLVLLGCAKEDDDEVSSLQAPKVDSHSPADGDTNTSASPSISVTFTLPMVGTSLYSNTDNTTCSGTLQVSSDDFATCAKMSGTPSSSNDAKTFTYSLASDLSKGTTYKLKITKSAQALNSAFLESDYTSSTGFATLSGLGVSSHSPASSATSVNLDASVDVTFDTEIESSSLTAITSGTSCSGSFQLSKDSFSTCVPFSTVGTTSNSSKTVKWTPSSNLSAGTSYTAKITTSLSGSKGETLSSDYSWSFTTLSALTVSSTSPASSAGSIAISSTIAATFGTAIDTSSLSVNTTSGTCTGTFQLSSSSSFSTCLALSGVGTASNSSKTITWTPASSLSNSTTYYAKLTTSLKGSSGEKLSSDYTWSFTTADSYKGMKFDGTSKYMMSNMADFGFSTNVTLALWMSIPSADSKDTLPLWVGGSSAQSGLGFFKNSTDYLEARVYDNTNAPSFSSEYKFQFAGTQLSPTVRYLVVMTYNDSTKDLKLYLNGVSQAGSYGTIGTFSSGAGTSVARKLVMGQDGSGTYSNNFTGTIHQIAIWDTVLDSSNVTALYNSGTPSLTLTSDSGSYNTSANLKHWWKPGSNSADIGKDYNGGTTISASGSDMNISTSDITDF